MKTVLTNQATNKTQITPQTNQTMSYNWKVDTNAVTGAFGATAEMTAKEKKNEATRRFREKEKIQAFRVQADIVNLEMQKQELEKKMAFEFGRTQAMSSQVNAMSNVFPSLNSNPNMQKARECISKANENYWGMK